MTKRVAIYARVSTDGQTVENQLLELRDAIARHGWEIAEEFTDNGVSGAKGRDKRPAFDALCKGAARREFDIVAAWSVDRLGRSLQHLVSFLEEIKAADVGLYLHKQGLDTSTPAGRAMFQMCGVFAEFERSMIQERIKAGLARTKKRIGRPPTTTPEVKAKVIKAWADGNGGSKRKISSNLGVPRSTVQRIIAQGE